MLEVQLTMHARIDQFSLSALAMTLLALGGYSRVSRLASKLGRGGRVRERGGGLCVSVSVWGM